MNVLVACEESQAVCLAFRKLGHNAFSCDLQECSGGYPEYHFKGDMFDVIANRGGTLENGTKHRPLCILAQMYMQKKDLQ